MCSSNTHYLVGAFTPYRYNVELWYHISDLQDGAFVGPLLAWRFKDEALKVAHKFRVSKPLLIVALDDALCYEGVSVVSQLETLGGRDSSGTVWVVEGQAGRLDFGPSDQSDASGF